MPQAQFGVSLAAGGVSISQTINRSAQHPNPFELRLDPGKAGTLTTRTDANTGTVTATAHGIADSTVVDVYWEGGQRFGMVVGSGTSNTFVIDGGAGDDLPAASTPLVVSPQISFAAPIDGDRIVIAGVCLELAEQNATSKGHALFLDGDEDEIADFTLVPNSPRIYDVAGGAENPFSGDPITTCKASNGHSSYGATLKIISMENVT